MKEIGFITNNMTKANFRWKVDFNVKCKAIKRFEDNLGEYFYAPDLGKDI